MLRVSAVYNDAGFDSLREDWNRLLHQSSSNTIFLTWEWMREWWRSYGIGKRLWIIKVERDGSLVGLAPLYQKEFRRFGVICYRGVYLIGDGSSDSDYLNLISKPNQEEYVSDATMEYLLQHGAQWDLFFLNEVPETSRHFQWFRKYFNEQNWYWEEAEVPCAYVPLMTDWELYLKSVKPRVRTKIRSLTSRLEQNFEVKFDRCARSEELAMRLASLFELHNRRWKNDSGGGVFRSGAKRAFYKAIASVLLDRGWLRLYSLSLNGNYVAHQFCFEYQNHVFLLQEGFDPTLADYGIGNVLRAYVFRDCIDRGVVVYDFLAGVTSHKLSWGGKLKKSIRGKAGRPTIKNRMFFELPRTFESGKVRLKTILPQAAVQWGRNLVRAGMKD